MANKVGRPTDSKKDSIYKLRVDEKTSRMLEYCARIKGVSKATLVRNLIRKEFEIISESEGLEE